MRRHIWGYSVCLSSIKGTPGLNELSASGTMKGVLISRRKSKLELVKILAVRRVTCTFNLISCTKVQVGKDQEKAQSET